MANIYNALISQTINKGGICPLTGKPVDMDECMTCPVKRNCSHSPIQSSDISYESLLRQQDAIKQRENGHLGQSIDDAIHPFAVAPKAQNPRANMDIAHNEQVRTQNDTFIREKDKPLEPVAVVGAVAAYSIVADQISREAGVSPTEEYMAEYKKFKDIEKTDREKRISDRENEMKTRREEAGTRANARMNGWNGPAAKDGYEYYDPITGRSNPSPTVTQSYAEYSSVHDDPVPDDDDEPVRALPYV